MSKKDPIAFDSKLDSPCVRSPGSAGKFDPFSVSVPPTPTEPEGEAVSLSDMGASLDALVDGGTTPRTPHPRTHAHVHSGACSRSGVCVPDPIAEEEPVGAAEMLEGAEHAHGHHHHDHGGCCGGHEDNDEEDDEESAALAEEFRLFVHSSLPPSFPTLSPRSRESFLSSRLAAFQQKKLREHAAAEAAAAEAAACAELFPRECSAETRALLNPEAWIKGMVPEAAAAIKGLLVDKAALLGGMARAQRDVDGAPLGGDGASKEGEKDDEDDDVLSLFLRVHSSTPASADPDSFFAEIYTHVYQFPLFSPEFTASLAAAVDEAEQWASARANKAKSATEEDAAADAVQALLRPNSMNRYGIVLARFGFAPALRAITLGLLQPLAESYYSWVVEKGDHPSHGDDCGHDSGHEDDDGDDETCNTLDSIHAFIVEYRAKSSQMASKTGADADAAAAAAAPGAHTPASTHQHVHARAPAVLAAAGAGGVNADRLSLHCDDSHVTINVCLGPYLPKESDCGQLKPAFEGGDLYLGGHRCEAHNDVDTPDHIASAQLKKAESSSSSLSEPEGVLLPQSVGSALVHLGRLRHAALPITSGRRLNLILWAKCSAYARRLAQGVSAHVCAVCDAQDELDELIEGASKSVSKRDELDEVEK